MNVVCNPKLASNVGKNKPITKLVIHTNKTAKPIPLPLNLSGIISEIDNQSIGSRKPYMKIRNSTVQPSTKYGKIGLPLIVIAKTAIISKEKVVPQKPVVSIVRRCIFVIK